MIYRTLALGLYAGLTAPMALAAGDGSGGPFEWLTHPATNIAFLAMVSFLLIVWFVGGFRAIVGMLDQRSAAIAAQLDEAKDLREAAAKALAEAERAQRKADEDAEQIIAQAKADAKTMREDAREALQRRMERREAIAEARIRQAEVDAAADVRRAAADAATEAASELLSKDKTDHFEAAVQQVESQLN